jgi:hypothetical protein
VGTPNYDPDSNIPGFLEYQKSFIYLIITGYSCFLRIFYPIRKKRVNLSPVSFILLLLVIFYPYIRATARLGNHGTHAASPILRTGGDLTESADGQTGSGAGSIRA